MKIMVKDVVTFNKCARTETTTGIVQSVENKGTPNEYYIIKTADGNLSKATPQDVLTSTLMIRKKKNTKPKVKKVK
jgi:hypothetical protein